MPVYLRRRANKDGEGSPEMGEVYCSLSLRLWVEFCTDTIKVSTVSPHP